MSTPHEKALKPKSKAALKREAKEAWKNRRSDPTYKALTHYKTDTSSVVPKKKVPDWAGDIGRKHRRNQKAETDKGYREYYR